MKQLTVQFSDHRKHEVWIGNSILKNSDLPFLPQEMLGQSGETSFIFADRNLKPYANLLAKRLRGIGWKTRIFWVKADESLKDLKTLYPYYGKLLQAKADRRSWIFALGGGVVGDAIGFLAGTYLRGVRWVGVPTTILAQVDSALGGKTGVNHSEGKNLIGVFHQPSFVLCDTSLLTSLSSRDRVSGLGEMIKYGFILDPEFLTFFENRWEMILQLEQPFLDQSIFRSLKWKAETVVQDERDGAGIREKLNFGHTLGHALEGETSFRYFRHGEAVIWGMRAALQLSRVRGHLSEELFEKWNSFLTRLPVPSLPKKLKASAILKRVKLDKKSIRGKVRFVLLKGVGSVVLDSEVSDREVLQVIRWMLSQTQISRKKSK